MTSIITFGGVENSVMTSCKVVLISNDGFQPSYEVISKNKNPRNSTPLPSQNNTPTKQTMSPPP